MPSILPHPTITPILSTPRQPAVAALWNDRYDEIDENFAALESNDTVVGLARVNHTHAVSPVTMIATDCSGFVVSTNTGATSGVIMLLPAGADGYRINAIVTAAYDLTFVANGTETIRYLSTVSKAGGSIKSASIGAELQLDWDGTQWVASVVGTSWQLETSTGVYTQQVTGASIADVIALTIALGG